MCSISERVCSIPIALLQFSLNCSNGSLGAAPELVVQAKPPEQDLDFTGAFHCTGNSTKRERDDKPLGIGCSTAIRPRSLPETPLLPWSSSFEDPIPLPDGRMLVTLLDAGEYITTLPKAEQQLDEWQAAIEALMLVSRGGP